MIDHFEKCPAVRVPEKPTRWVDAMMLAIEIEVAARDFPRYGKYGLRSTMRQQATKVCRAVRA